MQMQLKIVLCCWVRSCENLKNNYLPTLPITYSYLPTFGCFRADSVAWNPHKMLGAPLQCSLFLTKHKVIY